MHYESMPMQYTERLLLQKLKKNDQGFSAGDNSQI